MPTTAGFQLGFVDQIDPYVNFESVATMRRNHRLDSACVKLVCGDDTWPIGIPVFLGDQLRSVVTLLS